MADQAPAGRGQGDGKGGRKLKFAPTVPSRRKKAADSSRALSAAETAAANEIFQDLIRAAQSESKWERGRGRGFGRGRGGMGAQHVTFGGGDDSGRRPVGAAPPPSRLPGIKQPTGSSSAAAAAAPGSKQLDLKSKFKADPAKAGGIKPLASYDTLDGDSEDLDDNTANLFDFNQYYPTSLPLPLHHPEDDAADPEADAALMRQGVPQDLVLRQDESEDTAQHLGLTDLSAAQDYLYVFQLPAALPLAAATAQPHNVGGSRRAAAADGSSSSAAAGTGLQGAAGVKELPSGRVGKLLIFQSGKVKMQIGDVLLDVTAGVPCVTRQDVAAVSPSAKMLVNLGPVTQRAVVCPDVWQLMTDQEVPQWQRAAAAKQRQELGGAAQAAAQHAEMHAAAANGKAQGSAAAVQANGMAIDNIEEQEGVEEEENQQGSISAGHSPKDKKVVESSSEETGSSEQCCSREYTPASAVKQEAAVPAPAPAVGYAMDLFRLPTEGAAAARGRGRFRPAAARPARGGRNRDGMDVDR